MAADQTANLRQVLAPQHGQHDRLVALIDRRVVARQHIGADRGVDRARIGDDLENCVAGQRLAHIVIEAQHRSRRHTRGRARHLQDRPGGAQLGIHPERIGGDPFRQHEDFRRIRCRIELGQKAHFSPPGNERLPSNSRLDQSSVASTISYPDGRCRSQIAYPDRSKRYMRHRRNLDGAYVAGYVQSGAPNLPRSRSWVFVL